MKDIKTEFLHLHELFNKLVAAPMLARGADWKGEWEGWDRGTTWLPEACGVYILWLSDNGVRGHQPPVYIGEGCLGSRVAVSFHARTNWRFAQMLVDPSISDIERDAIDRRKALERLCILTLEPTENRD